MINRSTAFSGVAIMLCIGSCFPIGAFGAPGELVVALDVGGTPRELSHWSAVELGRVFKKTSNKERTPESDQVARWGGVLLQDVVDKALGSVPPEAKAEIDLVILKNDAGAQALVPRSVITKYPVLVAFEKNQKSLNSFQSIVPWSSRSKILEESLPLARYFVPGLTRVELTNYKDKFASLYLKHRMDPSAIRGEKLFVQNCVGCHGAGHGPAISEFRTETRLRSLASQGHPSVKGNPKLTDRDQRAILNYLEAYRAENPAGVSAAFQRPVQTVRQ